MLFKINGQWYKADGFNLVKVDAPTDENVEFFDGDAVAGELDGHDDPGGRNTELVKAYKDALEIARKPGATAEQKTAARAAFNAAVVSNHVVAETAAIMESLPDAPEAATPPNKPAEKPDEKPDENADDDDGDDDETPPGDGDGGDDVQVPDDLSGLPEADALVVSAAAAILRRRGSNPAESFANLMPGRSPSGGGRTAVAEQAVFTAGAGHGFEVGAKLDDGDIADAFRRYGQGMLGGRVANSVTVGNWQIFGAEPNLAVSADAAKSAGRAPVKAGADFHERRAHKLSSVQAAAPDRCGPSDVRREINYAGDTSSPLLNLIDQYPAPHCKLEVYKDLTLAQVADGITIWTEAARTDYQDALDTWRTTPNATNYAALKAAEKVCTIAGCLPIETVTMLPIAACLIYPNDLEYCSPESIRAWMRTLERAWLRERAANFLSVIATKSARVTVDASAAPFVNTETNPIQLGALAVADYVITSLLQMGVMAERVTEGNYVAAMPFGLERMLRLDARLSPDTVDEVADQMSAALGGIRVVTSLDTATGVGLPWATVPTQDGSAVAFSTILPPTDWEMALFDPDDFFAISRPNIELGAQMTPETVPGNMVFGGFMESFEGYGKDGAHPSWTIAFSNFKYNGARADRISPIGLG